MIDRYILWANSLTMEEVFIFTWVGAILAGALLAILFYRIWERDAANSQQEDADDK